jgi:para-aminobenzoate synthetase component 1
MFPVTETLVGTLSPQALIARLPSGSGRVLLQSQTPAGRYSLVTSQPFLTFRSQGSRCETTTREGSQEVQFGNPWQLLEPLLARFELADVLPWPLPHGGAFGYFGYELNQFLEPRLGRRAINDLELPDCQLRFYSSVVAFDHHAGLILLLATGLASDGSRCLDRARAELAWWRSQVLAATAAPEAASPPSDSPCGIQPPTPPVSRTSLPRPFFLAAVRRAQAYIHTGDIYQVNLAQRLMAPYPGTGWQLFQRLSRASPAPFAAWMETGDFELVSSSPESFLQLHGSEIRTRPIKGTRPRHADPAEDARLRAELEASEKERAELLMITDLLRNDLGRVCEFGSIRVPELMRTECYSHVQHLVSTVEGRLRPGLTHLEALAACFPGGSITGAPKLRAMEIIDELEPVARGPYCGCHGYLGFNRESQWSITIRTALVRSGQVWFHVGAGLVADSIAEAEYDETIAKAGGLLAALGATPPPLTLS